MKYYYKFFLWENGKKSTDYSNYVVAPIYIEPHLDETLGTAEVVLDCFPTADKTYTLGGVSYSGKTAFPCKTKFRIERYLTSEFTDEPTTFDYVVDTDHVEEYAGCPDICCHRIDLIEPSVIAQGMHADNFSLTYELQDVTMTYKTIVSSTDKVTVSAKPVSGSGYKRPDLNTKYLVVDSYTGAYYVFNDLGWYDKFGAGSYSFRNSFKYVWSNLDADSDGVLGISNLVEKLASKSEMEEIKFHIPTLTCYFINGTTSKKLFELPIRTKITRTTLKNGKVQSGTSDEFIDHFYNPVTSEEISSLAYVTYNENNKIGFSYIKTETYNGKSYRDIYTPELYGAVYFPYGRLSKFPALIDTSDTTHTNKIISFTPNFLDKDEIAAGYSYQYTITCTIAPYEDGSIIQSFEKKSTSTIQNVHWYNILWGTRYLQYSVTESNLTKISASSICCSTTFYVQYSSSSTEANPFLVKPAKYSCYDLIRKAMLTCDTRIIDNTSTSLDQIYQTDDDGELIYDDNGNMVDLGIQYPIIISSDWMTRLKETQLYETIFEQKNLWEIFLQVGYYLHAIPKLRFATDETDRFELYFKQLGDTKTKNNDSTKITIYNSMNMSEYFTQLDSYITNLYSPQNEVEEWLRCKTSDSSYLISNDTAEIQTKYNITQIDEFDIIYNGKQISALDYIFEKTVYNTLTSNSEVTPSKACSIYYEMGTNVITGLNYVPPTTYNDGLMALKMICSKLFGLPTETSVVKELISELFSEKSSCFLFNDLTFHIKYKTQDELRITQFKPNLAQFMRNSSYEKYPHHEQFYGQQDKIVDSERFSNNLWGKLVRMANGVYQCDEYAEIGEEKEVGDLVDINGTAYYVVSIENEYYNSMILQRVYYSKNYNQISQVVTIPSEPRFYEVSERSMVRREVRLMDFFVLSTIPRTENQTPHFIKMANWQEFIKSIIFLDNETKTNPTLPNFAYTNFKADKLREHTSSSGQTISSSVLYPTSEIYKNGDTYEFYESSESRAVIVPLLHFPLKNAIVFEWDMEDNFKAGDSVDTSTSGNDGTVDGAYYTLSSARYCDVYGGADLFSFRLFYKDDWTTEQLQRLPYSETYNNDFVPREFDSIFLLPDSLSIGLDKDNREALSFNYQINLLVNNEDDKNIFVVFSNIFGEKTSRLKMALLNKEISMFDETIEISADTIIADNVIYEITDDDIYGLILSIKYEITDDNPKGVTLSIQKEETETTQELTETEFNNIKSIVLYDKENTDIYPYIAKNVASLDNSEKLQSWYIYPTYNDDVSILLNILVEITFYNFELSYDGITTSEIDTISINGNTSLSYLDYKKYYQDFTTEYDINETLTRTEFRCSFIGLSRKGVMFLSENTTEYQNLTVINGMSVYPVYYYRDASIKVNFYYPDETLIVFLYCPSGESVSNPSSPTLDGYDFDGWTIDGETIVNVEDIIITEETNFYAKFTQLFNVTFSDSDGTLISTQTIRDGEYATEPSSTLSKTGYTYLGWSVDNTDTVDVATYAITQDTDFIALYERGQVFPGETNGTANIYMYRVGDNVSDGYYLSTRINNNDLTDLILSGEFTEIRVVLYCPFYYFNNDGNSNLGISGALKRTEYELVITPDGVKIEDEEINGAIVVGSHGTINVTNTISYVGKGTTYSTYICKIMPEKITDKLVELGISPTEDYYALCITGTGEMKKAILYVD